MIHDKERGTSTQVPIERVESGGDAELAIRLTIDHDEPTLDARAVKLDAMEPRAKFAVALIVGAIILDLQARGEIARAENPHGDGELLAMAALTRCDVLRAVVSAVRACCAVPRPLDRVDLLAADRQRSEREETRGRISMRLG